MQLKVQVFLKAAVLDPQGKAVLGSLHSMGFTEVGDVRVGKVFSIQVPDGDPETVKLRVEQMAAKLLCNPVIEEFAILP
jgi:phosphoribosylformylglycinamidine synthase PurS subunit